MNENSQQKMQTIDAWVNYSADELKKIGITSARLDAEIILAHTIRKSRTYLHAHNNEILSDRHQEIANARLDLRIDRTPIAYIIGHKEFYGRSFKVTPATLIPRPESEDIITLLKELIPQTRLLLVQPPVQLIDVGTGSGCLGISAKLEVPELEVTLSDISRHTLNVAESNARSLHADVSVLLSNLLENYTFSPSYILANLPYVDPKWERSIETNYEPAEALFANDEGLHFIRKLIEQAKYKLEKNGYLLIEADSRQHAAVTKLAKLNDFKVIKIKGFIIVLQKN
jgi:release factor glutamine methyltransferase